MLKPRQTDVAQQTSLVQIWADRQMHIISSSIKMFSVKMKGEANIPTDTGTQKAVQLSLAKM